MLNAFASLKCSKKCEYNVVVRRVFLQGAVELYSNIKPRRLNHSVNKTKLQEALTHGFGILRTENI